MKTSMRSSRPVAASVLAGLLCCLPASIQYAQLDLGGLGLGGSGGSGSSGTTTTSTSYRGRAVVVTGTLLGVGLGLSDTGYLDSSGGARESSALDENLYGMVGAQVCHATTIGQNSTTSSEASMGAVGLNTCNYVIVGGNVISAGFVMARATAACCTTPSFSGSAEVSGLV